MTKTVFVSAHYPMLDIANHLRAAGCQFVTLEAEMKNQLIGLDCKARTLEESLDEDIRKQVPYTSWAILKRLSSSFPAGMIADDLLTSAADILCAKTLPIIGQVVTIALALDKVKPTLCLLHNDIQIPLRAVALWARERGIPCIHVPHAVYQDINRTEPGTDIHDIITSSHIATGGTFQRAWYEAMGADPAIIRDTGMPHLDYWVTNIWNVSRARARRLLDLKAKDTVITYAATWGQHTSMLGFQDEPQQCYLAFLQAMTGLPNVKLLVKIHPNAGKSNRRWHAETAKQAGVSCQMLLEHLPVALYASDALVAYGGSNVLVEGALVPGLRLVTRYGYDDEPEIYKVGELTAGHFRQVLVECLAKPAPPTDRLLWRFAGRCDGQASRRVAEWGLELMDD